MRAAAIFGLGCSPRQLKSFQIAKSIEWHIGLPSSAEGTDAILLFGGDGTIHRHLGQLVKLGLPVLMVPTGSGNDFARALGLRRLRHSVAAWGRFLSRRDNVRAIDLGMVSPLAGADGASALHEPIYFCSIAGVGLDARGVAASQWFAEVVAGMAGTR